MPNEVISGKWSFVFKHTVGNINATVTSWVPTLSAIQLGLTPLELFNYELTRACSIINARLRWGQRQFAIHQETQDATWVPAASEANRWMDEIDKIIAEASSYRKD